MQRTLILVKPDGVQRRLVGAIVQRFEQKGLRLAGLKLVQATRDLAEKHYAVHKGKPFYDSLLQFLTAGPTVAMVWEGREAVAVARTLMGPTDGAKAPPTMQCPAILRNSVVAELIEFLSSSFSAERSLKTSSELSLPMIFALSAEKVPPWIAPERSAARRAPSSGRILSTSWSAAGTPGRQ